MFEPHGSAADLTLRRDPEVSISSPPIHLDRDQIDQLRTFDIDSCRSSPSSSQGSADFSLFSLEPAPPKRQTRTRALAKKLSTRFGFRRDEEHAGVVEAQEAEEKSPCTPAQTLQELPTLTPPPAPIKAKPARRVLRLERAIPFALSPKSASLARAASTMTSPPASPPSYREAELQQSWAAIGIDIHDPKSGPKPHCTPQQLVSAMDDFFGVSPCPPVKEKKRKDDGRQSKVDKIRSQGWS
ncbi:uncharacterized protein PSFLO_04112 [Pseudozyma flocculosa]|uniref:Uncharacterized protein n=2 Tax=Pseudozyma flocculosa TaxID=84751 RepID=A0A5C3F284_9BASI|nr:uncharacterized protein PSFLO_04112 [Pseudozyma flocculosa]